MPTQQTSVRLGSGTREGVLLASMLNRHGLITGATGTGKTVSLRVLAEHLSALGIPVFLPDVKGDLSGIAYAGQDQPRIAERVQLLGLRDFSFRASPVVFWDVFGKSGHPVRTTVSQMGPLLLGRLLGLNETQLGVLTVVFRVADDQGLLLLDLKDLSSMLQYVAEHADEYKTRYGTVSVASVAAIQRGILALEEQGGERFFGEPALDIDDFIQTTSDGRGVINVLAADQLLQQPKLYSTFLVWMLAELFENLPEVGDVAKPKLVFIFDESHLLFDGATPALRERIEQVVRLIRSKGVGVFFATQNPLDLPEAVLGQLGNRIQHALRAFTPQDKQLLQAVASTFRGAPDVEPSTAIGELAVGEALISGLDARGVPSPVSRVFIDPPCTRLAPLTAAEREFVLKQSSVYGQYEAAVDRESAYEQLAARAESVAPPKAKDEPALLRGAGTQVGRQIIRGLFDSMLRAPSQRRR